MFLSILFCLETPLGYISDQKIYKWFRNRTYQSKVAWFERSLWHFFGLFSKISTSWTCYQLYIIEEWGSNAFLTAKSWILSDKTAASQSGPLVTERRRYLVVNRLSFINIQMKYIIFFATHSWLSSLGYGGSSRKRKISRILIQNIGFSIMVGHFGSTR